MERSQPAARADEKGLNIAAAAVPVATEPLGHTTLGHFDSAVFVASLAVAAVLRYARHRTGQELTNEQPFTDMLSFWTFIELLLLFSADLDFGLHLPVPSFADLMVSNGILIPIALANCAFLVVQSTLWPTIASIRSGDRPKPVGEARPSSRKAGIGK